MACYRFTLPYPPSANRYWRYVNNHPTVSKDAKEYKSAAGWAAVAAVGRTLLECPVILRVDVYRPRKSGDLGNRIKIVEDALNGVVWVDDSQIIELHARRFDDKANPRVEVTVEEAA
jgi:crossover junction endodeoxyribonuclease RusA